MRYNSSEILAVVTDSERMVGNISNTSFDNVATLEEANQFSLIWIKPNKKNKEEIINNSIATVIVCDIQ